MALGQSQDGDGGVSEEAEGEYLVPSAMLSPNRCYRVAATEFAPGRRASLPAAWGVVPSTAQ